MNDLLTERLILHPLTIAEAERVAAGEAAPDDNWAADYPAEGERVGARMFVRGHAAVGGDTHPFGGYEIRRRSDGQAIGGIGFHGAPDADGSVSIGYGLAESARGQGYATEAVRGILAAAGGWGVTRLLGDTEHGNVPSQRVMLAAGMALTHEDAELKYYAATPA
ncbi:RimJ/RimL family protein N-acetyltransferase [Kitasatospora sp. MAA4]|uniref:GNAT family N-acetyltransferase n=1 Tax=Kitasatospora sp. MAA4 TaxID=3035093 RepID=UPI0024741614|nr:GNAT family N-acetyltransferase [Kitasatospora sp. MAA4]MDH6136456.1 RimJ/RimL family protein N-acetyltransferase [Kitasatospora sp. MAA4]